jgi:hypothetical protein
VPLTDDERRELEDQIMLADLAQKEAAKKLADRQIFWEAAKALAGILAAVAVLTGSILALSNYLHPANQQPMFPPGTVITIPPARP